MLVKEIIEHSIWLPSSDYEKYEPKVSIFLPTYANAKSGLFERALVSILNQTFKEFELIIVDDASTDGTKEIIDAYMQIDKRISCIHHPQNIGLLAISEYEAFMKSSGHYIVFAFDDFIFEINAIDELYTAITENDYNCCYGQANIFYLDEGIEKHCVSGTMPFAGNETNNLIANSSIILKRSVLETIGLYDPHILMARECDMDLWLRISTHYSFTRVEIMVGTEHAITQNDSLGHVSNDPRAFSRFYKTCNRNQQLVPENFADKNIIESQLVFGNKAQAYLDDLLAFYQSKFWVKNIGPANNKVIKKIAFYSSGPTNYHLCFESINATENYRVQLVFPGQDTLQDLYFLMGYDAVIVNRNLQSFVSIITVLKKLHIPCYYYIDDNFIALKNEYEEFAWYSKKNVTKILSNFDAVLTSTETLRTFFLQEKIHAKVWCYPPILNKALLPPVADNHLPVANKTHRINVAVIGGAFRGESFFEYVVPALNKLKNSGEDINLTVRKYLLGDDPGECLFSVDEIDILSDYNQYIHQLRHKKIDIIIHPYGKTTNSIYKTNSVLLNALYLNANIIVFGEPAFDGLGEAEGIMNIDQDIDCIFDAIKYLSIPANATRLKSNLSNYCHSAFNMDNNIKLLDLLMQNSHEVNAVSYERRAQALIQYIVKIAGSSLNQSAYKSIAEEYKSIQHCFEHLLNGVRNKEEIPQFKAMLSTLKYMQNAKGLSLKKGPLLNQKIFIEYRLKNVNETISEIMIACAAHPGTSNGLIGIELVLPNNTIALHRTKSLKEIDFFAPIVFHFPEVSVPLNAMVLLRVFVRNAHLPISVYELRSRQFMPSIKKKRQLFCSIA